MFSCRRAPRCYNEFSRPSDFLARGGKMPASPVDLCCQHITNSMQASLSIRRIVFSSPVLRGCDRTLARATAPRAFHFDSRVSALRTLSRRIPNLCVSGSRSIEVSAMASSLFDYTVKVPLHRYPGPRLPCCRRSQIGATTSLLHRLRRTPQAPMSTSQSTKGRWCWSRTSRVRCDSNVVGSLGWPTI